MRKDLIGEWAFILALIILGVFKKQWIQEIIQR